MSKAKKIKAVFPYKELVWDDQKGICDEQGSQLFQLINNYGSRKNRIVLGRRFVDLYNNMVGKEPK